MYGYAGKVLRVDLTAGTCGVDQLDEATARKWVGGSGLGTLYLLEEVPAGTKWSDPENLLVITTGPLGGSGAIGGGSINVAGLYTNSKSESFPSKTTPNLPTTIRKISVASGCGKSMRLKADPVISVPSAIKKRGKQSMLTGEVNDERKK